MQCLSSLQQLCISCGSRRLSLNAYSPLYPYPNMASAWLLGCDPLSCTGPCAWKALALCSLLWSHHLEILNSSWAKVPSYSFCTGPCRLYSKSCNVAPSTTASKGHGGVGDHPRLTWSQQQEPGTGCGHGHVCGLLSNHRRWMVKIKDTISRMHRGSRTTPLFPLLHCSML